MAEEPEDFAAAALAEGAATVHVMPVGDLIVHTHDDCPCGPRTIPVKRDDGSVGWVLSHHSLDGRERHEP